jgi:hypothetical protein
MAYLAREENRAFRRAHRCRSSWVQGRADKLNAPLLRRDIDVAAVFDIETENWDSYVVGGFLDRDGAYLDFDWRKEDRLVDAILGTEGAVWSHSGGTFDLKWLLDHVAERGLSAQIVAAGGRIVFAKVGKCSLYDSKALCPLSLEKFTKGLGVVKQKLELPCSCPLKCGGYCAIKRTMPDAQMRRLRTYLEHDCRSLWAGLESLREFAADNDLDLGATVGGSAWRNARRYLGLPEATLDRKAHKFARAGYYGGRVQLPRPGLTKQGWEYDVASMYPWTLATFPLPVGAHEITEGAAARKRYRAAAPGIYRARVRVPDLHLPPLPLRYDNASRTAYPTGTLRGTWPLPELHRAEEVGAVVVGVDAAITWEREELFFPPWIERLFALRTKVGKKGPLGQFIKLYLNSLTGKFGTDPERLSFAINPKKLAACRADGACFYDGKEDCGNCCEWHCTQKCGASIQYSTHIFARPIYHLDDCAHVHWSGYLTAQGRVALHRQQLAYGDGLDVVYCDTDSVFSTRARFENIGSELGQWEAAGGFTNFFGIAPKVYTFEHDPKTCHRSHGDDIGCDGRKTQKAKGVRLGKRELIVGETYEAGGILGFRAGAALGRLFKRNSLARKVQTQSGDRIPVRNGQTRAPRVAELKP